MLEYLDIIYEFINELLISAGILAPILSCVLIVLEALLPFLPLFLFISINFIAFGNILGFIVSWIFAVIGSLLVFHIIRSKFHTKFEHYAKKHKKLNKVYEYVNRLKITELTLVMAIPFTPSFIINIAAGLSTISYKKYITILTISKMVTVYFWGFIGKSLFESIRNPKILITIGIMLLVSYVLSLIVNKILNIKT